MRDFQALHASNIAVLRYCFTNTG